MTGARYAVAVDGIVRSYDLDPVSADALAGRFVAEYGAERVQFFVQSAVSSDTDAEALRRYREAKR